ncbi:MAG: hydroxymethylbilane synthase [Ardenticatenales bacterium]|nr:hydroxymethylbilane synthase [Ardenticatenales bacterium]
MIVLRVGTRGSPLALTQTDWVIERLRAAHRGLLVERIIIESEGDRLREASLLTIGGQGVFTRALELALLDGEIDVAVHSLKDLPSTLPEGLFLAATPAREESRDLLLTRNGLSLSDLPEGAIVGTGSLRRRAQLLAQRPDLAMKDIRGNVDTRLAKLERGEYDAIVLAAAGLSRLGWLERTPSQPLGLEVMLPAPAQGILGLECREPDEATRGLLSAINDDSTLAAATAERAVLRRFGIGCRLPLAALATAEGDTLTVQARVLASDGHLAFNAVTSGPLADAAALGEQAAEQLVTQGALTLLEDLL